MIRLLSRYKWHIIFWSAYCAFWIPFSMYQYGNTLGKAVYYTSAWLLGQAGSAYLAIYWLMPRYFNRRRYLLFALLYLLVLAVCAALTLVLMLSGLKWTHEPIPTSLVKPFLSVLVAHFYTSFLVVAVKAIRDKIRSDKRAALLEKERTDSELRFLKSQMNPHFLFNAINSIYVLIKKDPDFAGHTLVKFADMLRYQLYECNADVIPIEKEIGYLENYIQLEKLRKGDLIRTHYNVTPSTGRFSIAPLLLIPFVENAFKYVSNCPEKDNFVTVDLNFQDNIFELSVENSIDEETMMPKEKTWGGIGLENVRRRLQLIYDGRHALDISSREGIFSVLLTIKIA
ncbi:MAG: histidine kinase [Chitinophagaceae bacterium]|nr:histidine kinase [Chitinophagaceae bacterium]